METYLVVSALGKDQPGTLKALTRLVLDCGCRINDSRMAVLGSEFAAIMLLSGHWNAVAKLESGLPRVARTLGLAVQSKRTESRPAAASIIPYGVEVVSIDQPSVVHDIADFFASHNLNIEDLYTSTYQAPHTGAPMFSLHMTVGVPSDTAIAALRGEFMDFCDERNLDAVLAPVK